MFQGINTATDRCGVPDQQMFWCDGFIPLAPRNLRVLPGLGVPIYTGGSVVWFDFYNLGSTPYMVVFRSDGAVVQVRTTDNVTTTILPASTIINPNPSKCGIAQYGSQYLIIVAQQSNGYWVWDGTTVFTAGSLAPGVTLTNVGSGYTSPPTVTATGGNGSGATFSASVANGSVTQVVMTNPGNGYHVGDVPTLTFTGGNQAGSGANLTASLTFSGAGSGASFTVNTFQQGASGGNPVWHVSTVTINNGGSGYSSVTTASIGGPVANNNPAVVSLTITGGVITAVTVNNSGDYFSPGLSMNVTDNGFYFVSSVNIISGGSLYSNNPVISVTGGGSPQTQAVIVPVVTGGVIVSTNITNKGVYGTNTPPTLTVNDTAVTAAGTVSLMPFGLQGNCVETYVGHVWVANGATVTFSAPGSVGVFATSSGGGTFTSSDSFLRVGYTKLIQTNGFLFLIGDSSMNYISGVQTNTPAMGNPTTTFTNNNSDPETGTPYPGSVKTIGQDIFLANQNGIYVSTGGTFEKKSEALDGVYNTAPGIFNGMQLSAAKHLIFGKLIWMVLVPIIDPVTRLQRNKIFMFNQKYWWSSEQDVSLNFVGSQEINSVFKSYGTDGTKIYPMFTTPSTGFLKRMQSRLWDAPAGYDHTKSSVRLFAMARFFGQSNLSYQISIDNEFGIPAPPAQPYSGGPSTFFWQQAGGGPYLWQQTGGGSFSWGVGSGGISVLPPTAIGQVGVLTGMTTTTMCDDLVLISEMMQDEIVQYRG
jgi:hypothetical protein